MGRPYSGFATKRETPPRRTGKMAAFLPELSMPTIALLIASNLFMTIAWYGHLKYPDAPLLKVIFLSWLIAGVEYCFVVPANRYGFASGFTVGQLKIMQEVITLLVFAVFAVVWLGEKLKWNHAAAFACLIGAVAFMFADKIRA